MENVVTIKFCEYVLCNLKDIRMLFLKAHTWPFAWVIVEDLYVDTSSVLQIVGTIKLCEHVLCNSGGNQHLFFESAYFHST